MLYNETSVVCNKAYVETPKWLFQNKLRRAYILRDKGYSNFTFRFKVVRVLDNTVVFIRFLKQITFLAYTLNLTIKD